MGIEAKKVHLYDEDGKYLRTFESISEFARTYNYPDNILSDRGRNVDDVFEFEDGRIASLERIGRKGVKKYKEYKNSPYVGRAKEISKSKAIDKKVVFYDLDGDKIAEFQSIFHATILTNVSNSSFYAKSAREKGGFKTSDGLIIKFE